MIDAVWRVLGMPLCAFAILLTPRGAPGIHPTVPRESTLLERIERADAIALARVVSTEAGRLYLDRGRALLGEVPAAFQIKQSPLRPLPYHKGQRGVFFLRGARSPYLLADEAREALRFEEDLAAERFATAVTELLACRTDPDRLLALHVGWLAATDTQLRHLALRGLLDPRSPFAPVPPEIAARHAEIATDGSRSPELRRAAAALAATDPRALGALLESVPGDEESADPEVFRIALRAAGVRRDRRLGQALLRGLRHPGKEIRTVSIASVRFARTEPDDAIRRELVRIAASDGELEVRSRAEAALRRLGRDT